MIKKHISTSLILSLSLVTSVYANTASTIFFTKMLGLDPGAATTVGGFHPTQGAGTYEPELEFYALGDCSGSPDGYAFGGPVTFSADQAAKTWYLTSTAAIAYATNFGLDPAQVGCIGFLDKKTSNETTAQVNNTSLTRLSGGNAPVQDITQ